MSDIVQWLIRKPQGEIEGPLTTVEVIRKIRSGYYIGEEYLSRYPSGRWYPISYDQNFFNILLEVLEEELFEKPVADVKEKEEVTQRIENIKKDFEEAKKQKKDEVGQAVFEDLDAKTPVVIELEEKPKVGRAVKDKKIHRQSQVKSDVKPAKTSRRKKRAQLQLLIFFGMVGLLASVYYLVQPQYNAGGRFHLREPYYSKSAKASAADISKGMLRAIQSFRKDTIKDYLVAQDALVEVVEKSNSLDAYAFLCMTYRELWPFVYQDAKDIRTIQTVLRRVQKINPKSPSANICLVVSYWVKGRYDDALRIMDSHLAESPELIFFNQMSGDIHAARKDFRSAVYYFSQVRELWTPPPVWSKALLQEARMYRLRGIHGTALKLYRLLLKENPTHGVAKIELGLMELEPYQNISKAADYIRSGLSSKQFIPKMIEAEAYVALAKIRILKGDNRQALKYSQKAFSIDSSNQEARELTVSMGGIKALNSVTIDNVNMVYLGEQYMKMNNYNAAQAEFRAAFEANNQNGFAALRAGEALWELNQSNEAIAWIKKSIKADPNFIRSYLILADFQSARFDYINAIETLKAALRINPKHHGIYRGFGLVELRRRNYAGAIRFADKAMELYDTDIESALILANAHYLSGQAEEGFRYIQQAMELDASNEETHVTFAKILAALQGTDAGIDYLDKLITNQGKAIYMRAIGELLVREERFSEAMQYYFNALQKDPKDKKTLLAIAKIMQSQKDYDRARDYFLEAAAMDPSDAEPLFLIGQLYLDSSKNSFALKQFERVIVVNPHYPLAHYYAGKASLLTGDIEKALQMAEQERLMNPDIPEPYLLSAEAYYTQKQYTLCTQEYQKVLEKGLLVADVYIKLARCYRLAGSFDSALTMLNVAEKKESGNPDIYKELGALYHVKGSYIKAIEWYKRYMQLNPHAKDKKIIEMQIKDAEEKGRGYE